MDIIFYLFILFFGELFILSATIGIDFYRKEKNQTIVKPIPIMVKSNYEKNGKISKAAYWIQIANYIYILAYLTMAIIDVFFYKSAILFAICFYSVISCLGIAVIILLLLFIWSIKEGHIINNKK